MEIALAQLNYHIGNLEYNAEKIIKKIKSAEKLGADLVVFSELSVCGYPPADLLEFDNFIIRCKEKVEYIASHCNKIHAIVGAPSFNPEIKGKRLLNSAFVLHDGKIVSSYSKGLLPDYDIFDEYRYFQPADSFETIKISNKEIALTICEDLWNINERPLYVSSPMDKLVMQNPELIINISASPFALGHIKNRKKVMAGNAANYGLPLINVNQVGANTELLFDGGSLCVSSDGEIINELQYFEEDFAVIDLAEINKQDKPVSNTNLEKPSLLYNALTMGVKDFFNKQGFKKAIVGLSGGLDSALVLVIAANALGAENVWAILMPGPYSSKHSVDDAKELAENLNTPYDIIPITDTYNTLLKTLEHKFINTSFGTAEENLQARARAIILMGLSNKFGYMLLNTSNKSESAVGYSTLYGDMCGGLSVIGDVYKTDIYELANYINKKGIIIPENTINKPPSAELRPNQKDSDSLPEYEELDKILKLYIEEKIGKSEIISRGFRSKTVEKVLSLVNYSEHKRYQTPPVLRVSKKAFGYGRKMPIVAKY